MFFPAHALPSRRALPSLGVLHLTSQRSNSQRDTRARAVPRPAPPPPRRKPPRATRAVRSWVTRPPSTPPHTLRENGALARPTLTLGHHGGARRLPTGSVPQTLAALRRRSQRPAMMVPMRGRRLHTFPTASCHMRRSRQARQGASAKAHRRCSWQRRRRQRQRRVQRRRRWPRRRR